MEGKAHYLKDSDPCLESLGPDIYSPSFDKHDGVVSPPPKSLASGVSKPYLQSLDQGFAKPPKYSISCMSKPPHYKSDQCFLPLNKCGCCISDVPTSSHQSFNKNLPQPPGSWVSDMLNSSSERPDQNTPSPPVSCVSEVPYPLLHRLDERIPPLPKSFSDMRNPTPLRLDKVLSPPSKSSVSDVPKSSLHTMGQSTPDFTKYSVQQMLDYFLSVDDYCQIPLLKNGAPEYTMTDNNIEANSWGTRGDAANSRHGVTELRYSGPTTNDFKAANMQITSSESDGVEDIFDHKIGLERLHIASKQVFQNNKYRQNVDENLRVSSEIFPEELHSAIEETSIAPFVSHAQSSKILGSTFPIFLTKSKPTEDNRCAMRGDAASSKLGETTLCHSRATASDVNTARLQLNESKSRGFREPPQYERAVDRLYTEFNKLFQKDKCRPNFCDNLAVFGETLPEELCPAVSESNLAAKYFNPANMSINAITNNSLEEKFGHKISLDRLHITSKQISQNKEYRPKVNEKLTKPSIVNKSKTNGINQSRLGEDPKFSHSYAATTGANLRHGRNCPDWCPYYQKQ